MGTEQGVHDVGHLAEVLLVCLVLLLQLLLHLLVIVLVLAPRPTLACPRETHVQLVLHQVEQLRVLVGSEAVQTKELNALREEGGGKGAAFYEYFP